MSEATLAQGIYTESNPLDLDYILTSKALGREKIVNSD